MRQQDCIFCRIAAHEAPAFVLCETERAMAFMDINPVAPGHALVISKAHARTILDSQPDDLQACITLVQRVAKAVETVFQPDGISIVQSNGAGAAQSVPHFHTHVLPRWLYDDLPMNWLLKPGDRSAIEAAAEKLKAVL